MTDKTYNVNVTKFFDKELGGPMLELETTKELSSILENFCVTDMDKKATSYLFKAEETEAATGDTREYVYRYRLKNILLNTVGNNVGWYKFFDLFFTEEIIKNQKIRIAMSSGGEFRDIESNVNRIKWLIQEVENLMSERKLNITLTLEES